jgi:hypothetical protein
LFLLDVGVLVWLCTRGVASLVEKWVGKYPGTLDVTRNMRIFGCGLDFLIKEGKPLYLGGFKECE